MGREPLSIYDVVPGVASVTLHVLMTLSSDLMLAAVAPERRCGVVLVVRFLPLCPSAQSALSWVTGL